MNLLVETALDVQRVIDAAGLRSCIIGGLAVLRFGEPRMTVDVDISLFTGFAEEERIIDLLLDHFPGRMADAKAFARKNRVLLLQSPRDVPIDIALGGLPFEERMVTRATPFAYAENCSLRTCSAEDLIVLKAFANRSKDWADIEGIVARSGRILDVKLIVDELTPLAEAKESPEIVERLEGLLRGLA